MTDGVDHDATLRQVVEDSGWSGRYAFLIVISAMLSLLGLLMPSVAVLIGAMLLSPLMMPIIGLGFGIATLDFAEMRRSAFALGAGSVIAVVLSIVLVRLSPIQTITTEIAGRTHPTLFDLLVALLSAVAGAYALIRGRGGAVVGVAIAIALMPPLVVVGFGLATGNATVWGGALLLFVTNAVTIALTAALVARVHGFGSHLSPHHTGLQLTMFLAALGLLSVPLGAALRQIAFESLVQRQVRDTIRERFPDSARLGQLDIDYSARPIRVRAMILTPTVDPAADGHLADDLRARLVQPVDIHVDQLRTAQEVGAAEAAQIAHAADGDGAYADGLNAAVARLAQVAGAAPDVVSVDRATRTLTVAAAPLPGLSMAGYRVLEQRATAPEPGWTAHLVPPPGAPLPTIVPVDGVIDPAALDAAAWAAQRRGLVLSVRGGTARQRQAVAAALAENAARADEGDAGGPLRLAWGQPQEDRQR